MVIPPHQLILILSALETMIDLMQKEQEKTLSFLLTLFP